MRRALIAAVVLMVATSSAAAELSKRTLAAWERYVDAAERRIASELESDEGFLVQDFLVPEERAALRRELVAGGIVTRKLEASSVDGRPIDVPKGMVHHWMGSVFLPDANIEELLSWLKDYDAHHRYFDEVESSRIVSRDRDDFEVFLRLRRKKVVTVHYNTEHAVRYRRHDAGRFSSRSVATRIAELDRAGTAFEREKPPGRDRGFLWRLNSYWRFREAWGGVVVELESVSLSRGVPPGLRWLVGSYLDSVPRESIEATLRPIRDRRPMSVVTAADDR